MRQFLWGVVFGIFLVPVMYIVRLWLKYRSEKIDYDEAEWP
jgi:hypothetical protein